MLKVMLDKAHQQSRSKDESLRKLEENLHNLEYKSRGKDLVYKNQQQKIKGLEGQLEMKTVIHNQAEKQALLLSDTLKEKEETCSVLQQKIKGLECKLMEQMQESGAQSHILPHKVKEIERQLREQENNSEALLFGQKVKELEKELKEQENNLGVLFLHQKIKELEDKLNNQERQLLCSRTGDVPEVPRATSKEGKARVIEEDECMADIEPRMGRKSDPPKISRPMRPVKPTTGAPAQGSLTHKRVSIIMHLETKFLKINKSNVESLGSLMCN